MDAWTDTEHCNSRLHCDYCLGRQEWHKMQGDNFTMPKFGTCPHGRTLKEARERRAAKLLKLVADGEVTVGNVIVLAEKLNLDLEAVQKHDPTRAD